MAALPSDAEWITVADKRPVPYRDVVRQGVLVPIAPDGDVLGLGYLYRVVELTELPARWLTPTVEGEVAPDPYLRMARTSFSAERFVGVPVSTAVRALHESGRCLPVSVWLRLADVMLEGMDLPLRETTTSPVPHEVWRLWCGPHALGATLDGRLVMSPGPLGLPYLVSPLAKHPTLAEDWRKLDDMTEEERHRVGRVRKALRWCLSPWPFGFEGRRPGVGPLEHPELWDELRHLLTMSLENTTVTVGWLREQLQALWTVVPPVSEHEAAMAVLAASPETLREEALACLERPEAVPAAWADGKLHVLLDSLLEQLPDTRRFPLRVGSSVEAPAPDEPRPLPVPPPAPPAPQLSVEELRARGRATQRRIAEEDQWVLGADGEWHARDAHPVRSFLWLVGGLLALPFLPLVFLVRLMVVGVKRLLGKDEPF
jgi:hypothetical protein